MKAKRRTKQTEEVLQLIIKTQAAYDRMIEAIEEYQRISDDLQRCKDKVKELQGNWGK